jgi:hypothetical protein
MSCERLCVNIRRAHCHTLTAPWADTATHCRALPCTAARTATFYSHYCHTAAHCRTATHTRTAAHWCAHCAHGIICALPHIHCRSLPLTLPQTAARTTATHRQLLPHCRRQPHCRTAALPHTAPHCPTLPLSRPHTASLPDSCIIHT